MPAVVDLEQYKAELEAVIATGVFAKAPSLASLLEYVCTKYFEGQAGEIKEYNIAVEALGRPPSFDPRQDSIVRVEAFRLRKRLKQYYENGGAGRSLRIVIPPGRYVPQFVENVPSSAGVQPLEAEFFDEAPPGAAAVVPVGEMVVPAEPVPVSPASRAGMFPRNAQLFSFIGLTLVVASFATWIWWVRSHTPDGAITPARATVLPAGAEAEEVRILAGSSAARYVDHAGNLWFGDRFFHGGAVFATPTHIIQGTPDAEMFRSRREGDFSYDIPLKPGVHELHLFFAETLFGENNTAGGGESSRVFRVSINGNPVLFPFDVISDAGGSSTADERIFKDVSRAADGMLHLQFASLHKEAPFLNAIAILPGIRGKMRPLRMVAGTRNYTDRRGEVWTAERYFSHGSTVKRTEPVSGTEDPEIFSTERFGNFAYSIPAADGRYAVTLSFAETWFGPGQPGGGGVGSRLFDVYCNGIGMLRNFDVFRAAGSSQRAIQKTFRGVTPNAQGKILLSFVPVRNYACVNAIEVVDESN